MTIQASDMNVVMKHQLAPPLIDNRLGVSTTHYNYPGTYDVANSYQRYDVTQVWSLSWVIGRTYTACIHNVAIPGYYDNPIYYRAQGYAILGNNQPN